MDVPLAKPITGSLALQIQEIGYGFCASADLCKKCLAMLGVNIIPSGVAHVLAMMVRTYHGLKSGVTLALPETPWPEELKGREERETWDVANFVTVLHEIAPNLNWSEVVMELDHPGFVVKDKPGLRLLTDALLKGLRDKMFPIALLHKLWNNKGGQLSWLKQIILNPDVFCLEDVQHRNVSTEMLRIAPDKTDRFVAQWKCLDLIEILLQLSDAPGLYAHASECFLQAKKACPDLLLLGLLQISMPINQIRQELLLACMPIFLDNHPNSINVLQAAWNSPIHTQQLRQLMLSGMAEWYLRGPDDPLKLGRLLEIAHDLKALPYLLNVQNVQQFAFGLDLACLASRREYLKLEKWITYKIQELREPFVQACIIFLKGRFPNIVDGLALGEAPEPAHLPPETLATLLVCLQTVVSNVSPTSAQEIMQILQNCRMLLARKAAEVEVRGPGGPPSQQQPPGPGQQQPILRESLPPGGAGGSGFGNAGFPGAPMRDGKSMDSFAPSFGAAGVRGALPGSTLDSILVGVGMPNFGTIAGGGGGGLGPRFGSIAPTIFSQGVPATSPATASGGLGGSVMNFDQNFMHQQRPPEPMLMPIGGLRPHHTQQQQKSKSVPVLPHSSQSTSATAACDAHACPYCSLTFPDKRVLGQHKRYKHPKGLPEASSGHIAVPQRNGRKPRDAALNAPIDYSESCDFVFEHDFGLSDKKLAATQRLPTSILSAASDLSDLFSDDCQPAEQSSSSVGNPALTAQFVGQPTTVASAQSAGRRNAAGTSRRSSRRSRAQQMTTHCCEVHQKWFKSDADLKRHLNSKLFHPDTAALTEKCPHCPHLFSPQQKRNMQDHIATVHTGNFPFRCDLCRYGCSEERHLVNHLLRRHDSVMPSPRKPRAGLRHLCPECFLGFAKEADRSSHVREVHPQLPADAISEKDVIASTRSLKRWIQDWMSGQRILLKCQRWMWRLPLSWWKENIQDPFIQLKPLEKKLKRKVRALRNRLAHPSMLDDLQKRRLSKTEQEMRRKQLRQKLTAAVSRLVRVCVTGEAKLRDLAIGKATKDYWDWRDRVHSTTKRQADVSKAQRDLRKIVDKQMKKLKEERDNFVAEFRKCGWTLPADALARQREVLLLANAFCWLARKPSTSTPVAAAKPPSSATRKCRQPATRKVPSSLPSNQESHVVLDPPIRAAVRASSAAAPFRPRHCRMDPKAWRQPRMPLVMQRDILVAKLKEVPLPEADRNMFASMLKEVEAKLDERQQQRALPESIARELAMARRRNKAPACSAETEPPDTAGDPFTRRRSAGWINPAAKRKQQEPQPTAAPPPAKKPKCAFIDRVQAPVVSASTPRELLTNWPIAPELNAEILAFGEPSSPASVSVAGSSANVAVPPLS